MFGGFEAAAVAAAAAPPALLIAGVAGGRRLELRLASLRHRVAGWILHKARSRWVLGERFYRHREGPWSRQEPRL